MARWRTLGFDLIRSNPNLCGYNLTGMLDHAITGTISRTIITHGCTEMMVLSMLVFGGEALHYSKDSRDGDGPIYLSTYDTAKKNLVVQPTAYR